MSSQDEYVAMRVIYLNFLEPQTSLEDWQIYQSQKLSIRQPKRQLNSILKSQAKNRLRSNKN
jgi:hypothetical protein